jgi:hypothetical protein
MSTLTLLTFILKVNGKARTLAKWLISSTNSIILILHLTIVVVAKMCPQISGANSLDPINMLPY